MKNPYLPTEAKIEEINQETPNIKTFVLEPKEKISFAAGQFVELTVPGIGEAPFTPSSDPNAKGRLEISIMNVGLVTSKLHQMQKGQKLGIRGPYGKGYPFNEFEGKGILIVGGGVGLAPLRSLLYSLFSQIDKYKKVYIKYGARTPADRIFKKEIDEWAEKERVDVDCTVDVGDETWRGKVGLVTTLLEGLEIDLKNSVAVVCGPPIMMKFVTLKLLDVGYQPKDIYLSMEKNMSCGLGKCGHCALGRFYVCKDGPVFSYDVIKDIPEIWG